MTKSQIPGFQSSWTSQMEAFLRKERETRGIDFHVWVFGQIPEICKSWGDDSRLDRVIGTIQKVVDPGAMPMVRMAVEDWQKRFE